MASRVACSGCHMLASTWGTRSARSSSAPSQPKLPSERQDSLAHFKACMRALTWLRAYFHEHIQDACKHIARLCAHLLLPYLRCRIMEG